MPGTNLTLKDTSTPPQNIDGLYVYVWDTANGVWVPVGPSGTDGTFIVPAIYGPPFELWFNPSWSSGYTPGYESKTVGIAPGGSTTITIGPGI